ncbi:MAG: DNA photolyase [Desulfobacteraceae bacterium]|nr:DNA photolyase [Desulfobacteraceae bacterium]
MKITHLYIDQEALEFPATSAICASLAISPQVISDSKQVYDPIIQSESPVDAGKTSLWLTRNRGKFVRPCPGTEYYTCCDYTILHIGTFCTMDCSYCILQSYFHPPVLQYFVNHADMDQALDDVFARCQVMRIGTGEFTDSLIWESIYPHAATLIKKFAGQCGAVLELKTKTVDINHLLGVGHNRKTILSWSLNTETMIKANERRTSTLNARLNAAAKCVAAGYPVAFHFDPMVIYPGCEDDYRDVISRLFAAVSPDQIVWISLGTFRFMPALKPVIEKRFDQSTIVYGEFIRGMDGKMRYFKPLRIRFYRAIIAHIRRIAPNVTAYFCMEDDEVWHRSFGFTPAEKGGLPRMLDESAIRHCGLTPNK